MASRERGEVKVEEDGTDSRAEVRTMGGGTAAGEESSREEGPEDGKAEAVTGSKSNLTDVKRPSTAMALGRMVAEEGHLMADEEVFRPTVEATRGRATTAEAMRLAPTTTRPAPALESRASTLPWTLALVSAAVPLPPSTPNNPLANGAGTLPPILRPRHAHLFPQGPQRQLLLRPMLVRLHRVDLEETPGTARPTLPPLLLHPRLQLPPPLLLRGPLSSNNSNNSPPLVLVLQLSLSTSLSSTQPPQPHGKPLHPCSYR